MNDHTSNGSPLVDPTAVTLGESILDLDALLSGMVPLAEKAARICTRPDLEARLDELEAELALLVDDRGNPYDTVGEEPLGGGGRSPVAIAHEAQQVRVEMAESMRTVRMRQLPEARWRVFREKHADTLDKTGALGQEGAEELIVQSAVAPAITADQLARMQSKLGLPALDELATVAWAVNTRSGVGVPFSPRSSAVLRRQARSLS